MPALRGVPNTRISGKVTKGAAIINNSDKNGVQDYLLGRLPEADEEQFELRLLSDPAFGEEFDTIVDELTDDYLKNELPDDERKRVEKYFLSTTERQTKLEFATELLRRAESERGRQATEKDARPSFFESIRAFWRQQSFAPVALLAIVVIVAGLSVFQVWSTRSGNYQTLSLTISDADRANGATPETVKLAPNTGLKLTLTIPENARGADSYAARLVGGADLNTEPPAGETVTVVIPAGKLTPGSYAIQLSKVKPDKSTDRIPGSYYFAVE